jgi:hypothetical protein
MKHPNKSSFDPSPFELNLGAINGVLFGIGALMLLPSIVLSHWPDAGKGILPCVIWEIILRDYLGAILRGRTDGHYLTGNRIVDAVLDSLPEMQNY